ncbi:hypothetical protein [Cyanobium sp. NIES-981]|uniref:hypothetical protein n=1 Tax=Cyanobium sp. NIES-981 TaxID=1851505 RepID=UPI0007DD4C9F|nr:hypothetical protein [Cyanobium sp. NIES-981]SBO44253.1 protein of unknown function [Cyanobium sp. NIES-981]
MWKTLGGFWAQTSPISYILAEKTAHIHCAAVDVAFLRRPFLVVPQQDAPARDERPKVSLKSTINDYSDQELEALILWLQSDGILRSDDEIIASILPELGFKRRGARIVARLADVIARCRKSGLVT